MKIGRSRTVGKVVEWTVGVCSVVVILVILSPMLMEDKGPRRSPGLAALKQYATAANIYFSDYNDRFPPDMSCARSAYRYIGSYVKNESILDAKNGESREWLGNGSLAGQDVVKMSDPGRTLMFFDSAPRNRSGKFPGVRVTTAADTSARSLQEPSFQDTIVNHWVVPEEKP